jgi:ribosomal protein L13
MCIPTGQLCNSYPGGLKERRPHELRAKGQSQQILRHAVSGMIPRNKHKLPRYAIRCSMS